MRSPPYVCICDIYTYTYTRICFFPPRHSQHIHPYTFLDGYCSTVPTDRGHRT